MASKFAVRKLVLTFIPSQAQIKNLSEIKSALGKIMTNIVGSVHVVSKNSGYIFMPYDCDIFELKDTMLRDFRKHKILKGLKFKIDLSEEPFEV